MNVEAATIPPVMSGLTPSPKLFLNSKTSSSNVPLAWPYYLSVWPPQHDNGLLGHGYDTWHRYLIRILVPHNSLSKLRVYFILFYFLFEGENGFLLSHTIPAHFFDSHT